MKYPIFYRFKHCKIAEQELPEVNPALAILVNCFRGEIRFAEFFIILFIPFIVNRRLLPTVS